MNKLYSRFFDSDEPLYNLIVFRFLYSVIIALQLISKFNMFDFQAINYQYRMITAFDYFSESFLGLDGYIIMKYSLILLMIMTAFGIGKNRVIYLTSLFSFLFLYPLVAVNSLQSMALIPITFFALASSEYSAESIFNLKSIYSQKIRIPNINIEVLIYIFDKTYLLAGMSKIINNKEAWMIGDGARGALLHVYLLSDVSIALSAFKLFTAYSIFSWGIIVFQISFIFIASSKKLRSYLIFLGFLFHMGVFILFKINFFEYYFISYLIFIDWHGLTTRILNFRVKSSN